MRRRAVSGETARGVGFCFFLEVAPVSEGDSFTPSGVVMRLRAASGATAREGHCGSAVGFVLEVVAGGEVESCEGEVVAARDSHGACLPGSAFWK